MKTRVLLVLLAIVCIFSLTACQSPATQSSDQPTLETETKKPVKTTKPAPPPNEYRTAWNEDCTVAEAFATTSQQLTLLGIETQSSNQRRTRIVATRDPRSGRTLTKRVPVSNSGQCDELSAFMDTRTALNIALRIEMYLESSDPPSTNITIKATSGDQSKQMLQKQCSIIRQKISHAIQHPEKVVDEPTPYPKTMTFDLTVNQVYQAIYEWAEKERLDRDSKGQDRFYKYIRCSTGSGIQLTFNTRLIEETQTKLEIDASNYENNEEFEMIIRSLLDVLEALKTGSTSQQEIYTETMTLNETPSALHNALTVWAKENGFSESRSTGGDQFYKYCSFYTKSKIYFDFKMHLTDPDQTKLQINIRGHEDKEEFPMILKSLKETLSEIE